MHMAKDVDTVLERQMEIVQSGMDLAAKEMEESRVELLELPMVIANMEVGDSQERLRLILQAVVHRNTVLEIVRKVVEVVDIGNGDDDALGKGQADENLMSSNSSCGE